MEFHATRNVTLNFFWKKRPKSTLFIVDNFEYKITFEFVFLCCEFTKVIKKKTGVKCSF